MIINADLHIHSKYSKGTSKYMDIEHILKYGKLKGLSLIGTGDCLNPKWLNEIKEYSDGKTENLLLTTEVEDIHRVHHLIFLPNISKVEELRSILSKYSKNIDIEGRPHIVLDGKELLNIVHDVGGLIGPAHCFTPWTSIYKSFNSIYDCYEKKPDFIELGLSADTDMADMIDELRDINFLSNSDAHSFYPHRLGREFNQFEVDNLGDFEENFEEVKKVLKNNKIVANYGLDPNLGKYHLTACTKCYLRYHLEDAEKLGFKCDECGGRIKKGVLDRIKELSLRKPLASESGRLQKSETSEPCGDDNNINHPDFRPPYYKVIPLSQIISLSIGKNIGTKSVDGLWQEYIEKYGNEIDVLINADVEELRGINEKVGRTIELFRRNKIYIYPGGGGEYGKIMKNRPKIKWYEPKVTLDKWIG
ncbi:MAG: hypothetical protein PWP15_1289 [Methanothermococcus sp.]|uniref:TIGR00375 family protein n=1 Tax=Methanothermococcus TaxID=155862 RepID=UPI000378BF6F|nr:MULTISPECIES: TIGR00375 family protein [Methanothermococcus]MDK2790780.1 hypothetical protein [Methanothermococcus sp.]